jgi:hypothetical protein
MSTTVAVILAIVIFIGVFITAWRATVEAEEDGAWVAATVAVVSVIFLIVCGIRGLFTFLV